MTTIFDKIINRQIPASIVYEDQHVLAFKDVQPQAPVHILLIPKNKNGLTGLNKAQPHHQVILGKLLVAAAHVAKAQNLNEGYRIVINDGQHAGQTVFHLHVHLLGGAQFGWPPGTNM